MYFLLLIIFIIVIIISGGVRGGNEKIVRFLEQNCVTSRVYSDGDTSELKKKFPDMVFLNEPEMYCVMIADTKTANKYLAPTWFDGKEHIRDENPDKNICDNCEHNNITAADNAEDKYNPPVVIKKHEGFNVFRDDLLLAGTKQRGIMCYIRQVIGDHKVVAYAGPSTGAAQVVLGLIKKEFGVRAVIFTDICDSKLKQRAKKLGVEYKEFHLPLYEIQKKAKEFPALLLPFGLDDTKFRNCLAAALERAIPAAVRMKVKRLWCVAGSGTLTNIFYNVFPHAFLCIVQVGKKIYLDQIQPQRTRVFIAPEKFYKPAKHPPPYPSVINYDAKLWQFAKKYGTPGDYIWNVA